MKKIALLLSIAMLFTLGNAPMGGSISEITLNANQATSASDIEKAIESVTDNGTHPGIVTLDSSQGDFVYTAADRSINIYYSNITLRSKNNAVIANCGDGIFFDDFVTDNIIIEGIQFICENGIIAGYGTHRNVTIKNNIFIANNYAISAQGADGWVITGNHTASNGTAIHLIETTEAVIANNSLIAPVQGFGVHLENSTGNSVRQNKIVNGFHGIIIGFDSSANRVTDNRIYRVGESGILFQGNNEYNSVLANKVSCQPNTECAIVKVENPPLSTTNKVRGNRLLK